MQAYVYGDNFVIKGVRRDLYDFSEHRKGHMWAKNEGVLGPDPAQGDVREVVCLNRVFRCCLLAGGRAETNRDRGGREACRHLDPPSSTSRRPNRWPRLASRARPATLAAAFGQAHPASIDEHACEPLGGGPSGCEVRVQGDCSPDERTM